MSSPSEPVFMAVIIPHFNDIARLRLCLAALAPQLVAEQATEAVVVDNDTPGGLAGLAAEFPFIRFVTEPRRGAALARNRGAAETRAPHIAFLDSDCVPAPDWLSIAVRLAREAPDTVFGGRVDVFDETPPPRSGAEAFETVFAFHQRTYIERKGFSVSANLLVPRTVWDATGEMVSGLSEDMDWCRRAVAGGAPLVYADSLAVRHPTRSDWPALRRKLRRTTDELYLTHGTSPVARLRWGLRALAVLASFPIHSVHVLRSAVLTNRERGRGILMLLRVRTTRAAWMLVQAAGGGAQQA